MKNDPAFKFVALVIVTGVIVALFSPSAHAETAAAKPKKTRTRAGTYQGSNGASGTINSTTTRGAGERTNLTTVTNQQGQTATHASDRVWNKGTGTGTVASSSTGFNGATTSRQGTLTKNADGSVSSQGTVTGPKGQASTYAGTTVKTGTGSSTTGTITGPNGRTSSYDTEVSKTAPGQVSRVSTVTGANGKTAEKDVTTLVHSDGTGTRVINTTKPDGTTASRTETFTQTVTPATPSP